MVEDELPNIGSPARRALAVLGVTTLTQVSEWTELDLLAVHGVGPKAVQILREALRSRGETFRSAD